MCPRCKEEDETPGHIVFRCQTIKRVKDVEGRGRRQWAAEEMRWDSWDALASNKWVRRENTGRIDEEGKEVFEKVDLMEEFFENVHHQRVEVRFT